jgi:hypothetical protein
MYSRATVVDVDTDRHTVSVELQGGRRVDLDATYLEHGHLDHGYALTAHAAQGATVDRAFVLGSDDLYREWGYTALTRHRDEARFYLVSPGSTERCLPGVEPEHDPLLQDIGDMLGDSRQKSLAIDLLSDERLADDPASRIAAREHALAEEARAEAERRLAALRAERAELSRFRRARRAELDAQIELQTHAIAHWQTELARPSEPQPRHRPTVEPARHLVDADELRSTIASAARPESVWEREAWARQALHAARPDLAVDPVPDVDLAAPDLDLGP